MLHSTSFQPAQPWIVAGALATATLGWWVGGVPGFCALVAAALVLAAAGPRREGLSHLAGTFHAPMGRRGVGAWVLAAALCLFYTLLYWYPAPLAPLVRWCDPLSEALRGVPADSWFLYGTLYSVAVAVMGVRFVKRWGAQPYQRLRTLSVVLSQVILAWWLPGFLRRANQPEVYVSYFWPLDYDALFPSTIRELSAHPGGLGGFFVGWSVVMTLLATPILTWWFGKRWYCSWVCGCGGLAETAGDPFRHLADKGLTAWRIERWSIHLVLLATVVMTVLVILASEGHAGPFHAFAWWLKSAYAFGVGAVFSGVVGVGFYPLFGPRIWCRFGCPMAAGMGLIQRFWSRFRITTNGGQCISCGNCTTYCEMGIDVRSYAQRGENIVRASCVGCGACATVCPRGVLKLEGGDPRDRFEGADQPLIQIRRSLGGPGAGAAR